MRRNLLSRIGLVAVAVLAWQSAAWAEPPTTSTKPSTKPSKSMVTPRETALLADLAAVEGLSEAHWLLVNSDRDYEGHRDLADVKVREALNELGYDHFHPKLVRAGKAAAVETKAPRRAPQP